MKKEGYNEKTTERVDYDWLTRQTGDPFADTGGYVINYLQERNPGKDILDLIYEITKVYVNKWEGKINTFFLNSPITQPAFKGERKIEETMKYFRSLIDESAPCNNGLCRISGRRVKVFKAGRDNTLMSGSGTFVNFHHGFQSGMMLSKEIIIRMFFIPFGTILIGGKVAIIQTNLSEIDEFLVRKNMDNNYANLSMSASDGALRSQQVIPANALFQFVDTIVDNIQDRTIGKIISMNLFHLSNFGASPEMTIYKLPSVVFAFYVTCYSPLYKEDWILFLRSHYRNSKFKEAKYNSDSAEYEMLKKGTTEKIGMENYVLWRNIILENLLNGKSLLGLFLSWSRRHKFNFNIVEIYQKHVRNMKQETLDKIKEIALFIANKSDDTIKKSIKALDGYKSSYELRRFFLKKVVAPNYLENKEPIITLNELVYYLFPDDISWREIRDLLLVAIFQELHAKNKRIEADLQEVENENTESEDN